MRLALSVIIVRCFCENLLQSKKNFCSRQSAAEILIGEQKELYHLCIFESFIRRCINIQSTFVVKRGRKFIVWRWWNNEREILVSSGVNTIFHLSFSHIINELMNSHSDFYRMRHGTLEFISSWAVINDSSSGSYRNFCFVQGEMLHKYAKTSRDV